MVRTSILVGVAAMSASASAFLAPIPGHSLRNARSASVQMVTSPGVSSPSVSSPTGQMASSESVYTDALKKMEQDCLADLEKAFDETAKTAKAESEKIWGELNAEFAEDDSA